ncbi:MAG TPA: hypothetical protein VK937_04060 [Candidatus Limnocylindria bacterium]|jgi:hypothetical protein|nr:hypothetical protein [Candidatus Limnocylindria bacterium]
MSGVLKLKVVSLASAYRYKGKAIDPPTVARELGVHTILTGRMLQQNDNVSISAEFVDAEHDRVMWSKQHQWRLADVPNIQTQITQDITENLKMNLSGAEKSRMAQRPAENGEVYQLYLRGRFYWNKRTAEGVLAESHVSMGQVLENFDWGFGGAEREFRRALVINPG